MPDVPEAFPGDRDLLVRGEITGAVDVHLPVDVAPDLDRRPSH